MSATARLTRPQLSAFLGNDFDAITQFELLFDYVSSSPSTPVNSTDDLPEGSVNLYFTDERVDDRVANLIQDGTGISWLYSDSLNTLTGTVTLAPFTTSDLAEGTNLYWTTARGQAVIDADTTLLKVDGSRDATGTQQFENVRITSYFVHGVETISADATISKSKAFVDSTGITVTMPSITGDGQEVTVISENTSGTFVLQGNGSETIEGSSTATVYGGEVWDFASKGSNWKVAG